MAGVKRRILVAVFGLLLAAPFAHAESPKAGEYFYKMDKIVLELWDRYGVFHSVFLDLVVDFPQASTLKKATALKITRALQSLPYEDLEAPDGADKVKAIALDIIHHDPGGETAKDVLLAKFLFK